MLDAGCTAPLIGDFHYNGHLLLTAIRLRAALDKYRINPGNVGTGRRRDEQFSTICKVAIDNGKPVRIGVNGGSLNQELVVAKMEENTDRNLGRTSEEILNECMVISAIESTALAIETGLRKDQIIISCKVSRPRDLIAIYRDLARKTDQPLHLGLTEAGMGMKGLVWSASAIGVLLNEGIGTRSASRDTASRRRSPRRGVRRVRAAAVARPARIRAERHACPGCGRTTSSTFQELAERTQDYIREQMPTWKRSYEGVENLTLAVMGCVVNGPGESKAANIGISLRALVKRRTAPSSSTASTSRRCVARTTSSRRVSERWSTTTSRLDTRSDPKQRAERSDSWFFRPAATVDQPRQPRAGTSGTQPPTRSARRRDCGNRSA
jgi:(E)-4-hydroxy-3-methylbut-2-enyl-diphosphate synthase